MKRAVFSALLATCALAPLPGQAQQFTGATFGLSYLADSFAAPTYSTARGNVSVELAFSDAISLQGDLFGQAMTGGFDSNEQGLNLSLIFRPSESVTLALLGGVSGEVVDPGAVTEVRLRTTSLGLRARVTPANGPLSFEARALRRSSSVISGLFFVPGPSTQFGLSAEYAVSTNLSASLGFEAGNSDFAVLGARYRLGNGFSVAGDMRVFSGAGGGSEFRLTLSKEIGGGVSFGSWGFD